MASSAQNWVAALKPTTVGVAAYRDDVREYLEIAVIHLTLRPAAKLGRLTELVHRAIPYPVLAVATQEGNTHLSLAHKRWSHGDASKMVLDSAIVEITWTGADDELHRSVFLAALALGRQPHGTLFALYHGWIDTFTGASRGAPDRRLRATRIRRRSRGSPRGLAGVRTP